MLENSSQILTLTINKLPKVAIETSFSWETVISATIAGCIPAFIAYIAMKENFRLANHQSNLQDQREFSKQLRLAVAEHVTNTTFLASAYEQWFIRKQIVSDAFRLEQVPEEIITAIKESEKSKHMLTLLIEPTKDGIELLGKVGEVQKNLEFFKSPGITPEQRALFLKARNDLIYKCHEFLRNRNYK